MVNNTLASDVLSKTRGFYSSLSSSERRVADFVLGSSIETIRMTLAEVAQKAKVSDATVLRYCRSIGFDRWLEFKIALTQSLSSSPDQILDEVIEGDKPGKIALKVFNQSVQALNDTMAVVDEKEYAKAIRLIQKARRILLIGVGTSGPIVNEFYNRLLRLGLNCNMQTDSYIQAMESALLGSGDLVITISQTGDSSDPLRTTAIARENGASVIVITGNTASKLTELADVVLLSVSHETRVETIASRIAQYAIVHALYVGLAMENMDTTIENEQRIWKAMMETPIFQNPK